MMAVPYYVTPLLGALAWSLLGAPESGFINQLWRAAGGTGALIDVTGPIGIAWVMALFEGSVAFVMISAVMKSMDPALEEASQVIGGGRMRTMLRITLPLVAPGVLGAGIYVFAEMLGSFSAALVLGSPNRFYVITTAIYQLVSQYPPRLPLAAAMGVSLFAVMFAMLFLYRLVLRGRSYVTVGGKAFRPRAMDVGALRWPLFAVCVLYVFLSVLLPVATLAFASVQRLATIFPDPANFTLEHYRTALSLNAIRSAMGNSLMLGFFAATIGVVVTGLLAWLIQRSRLPGRGVLEYLVMFPQAVPRLVFAFGLMWAWLVFPLPIYGTIWLLLIAYLTVFLPLGVRAISGVLVQLDKSLEECGEMCGASWLYRLRTITMPLLKPGLLAAWLLIFIASVRELGASILLMGPNSKVLTPAIVEAFFSSSSELTAAMALIQTVVVGLALLLLFALVGRALRLAPASP
jgi:iron(III) transport system permease protein